MNEAKFVPTVVPAPCTWLGTSKFVIVRRELFESRVKLQLYQSWTRVQSKTGILYGSFNSLLSRNPRLIGISKFGP